MIYDIIALYKREAKFRFDVSSNTLVILSNLIQAQLWLACRHELK